VALPIWTEFMLEATRDLPALPFPVPPSIVTCKVCSESGLLALEECPEPYDELYKSGTQPDTFCSFHLSGGSEPAAGAAFPAGGPLGLE
jgi:penicillin-binding protein 1A